MQLTFLSEVRLVSPSQSQDSAKEWRTRVATSLLPILPLLNDIAPRGWFGRTSPAPFPLGLAMERRVIWSLGSDGKPQKEVILDASFTAFQNSGMGSPTGFLTLSSSEWNHTLTPSLRDEGVCSLSDILETGDVPQRFCLSAKACQGILRRAEKRGKVLAEALKSALLAVASQT